MKTGCDLFFFLDSLLFCQISAKPCIVQSKVKVKNTLPYSVTCHVQTHQLPWQIRFVTLKHFFKAYVWCVVRGEKILCWTKISCAGFMKGWLHILHATAQKCRCLYQTVNETCICCHCFSQRSSRMNLCITLCTNFPYRAHLTGQDTGWLKYHGTGIKISFWAVGLLWS